MTNRIELALEMIEEINNSEKKALEFPVTEKTKTENEFLKARESHCGLLNLTEGQVLLPDITSGVGRAIVSIGSAQLRGASLLISLEGLLPDIVELPDQGQVVGSFAVCETVDGFYKLLDLAGVWPINFPRPSSIARAIERKSKSAGKAYRYVHDSDRDGKIAGQPLVGLYNDADKESIAEYWTFRQGKKDNVSVFSAPASYILGVAALEAAWRRQKPKKQSTQQYNENGEPIDADGNVIIDDKIKALNMADADLLLASVEMYKEDAALAKADLESAKASNLALRGTLAAVRDKLAELQSESDKKKIVSRLTAICAELAKLSN